MKHPLLLIAIVAALGAAACTAHAQAITWVAPAVANPHAPAYRHEWRHGAIPTRQVLGQMKAWAKSHASTLATNPNLLSYGGGTNGIGVMSGAVKVYQVFYGTQWGTASTDAKGDLQFTGDPSHVASVAQEMFKGIGTNNELWQADLTQWCDGTGVPTGATTCPKAGAHFIPYQQNVLAGVWYDNAKASPAAATAAQLGNVAVAAAKHFGNTTAASNRYAYYIIMSPHLTNPDHYQGQYCAWHDFTADVAVTSPYGELAFSNQPYNTDSGSGCGVGFVNSPGLTDGYSMTLGQEWHETMTDTLPFGGWANHSSNPPEEDGANCGWIAQGSPGGAANVTFATGTFAEQAVWSNDTASCAISHPIVNHGTGGGTPIANFSYITTALQANFTDSSTDIGGSITGHSWKFGDGKTGTATNPSHTYAAAGTYSVTETVTDSASGKTSSKTESVTVSSP